MRLNKNQFHALCAVVWADGKLVPEEAEAIVASAKASELSESAIADIRQWLATPVSLSQVPPEALGPDDAEAVFALACILAASDGEIDPSENGVISAIGDRFNLSSDARARAAAAGQSIVEALELSGKAQAIDAIAKWFNAS